MLRTFIIVALVAVISILVAIVLSVSIEAVAASMMFLASVIGLLADFAHRRETRTVPTRYDIAMRFQNERL